MSLDKHKVSVDCGPQSVDGTTASRVIEAARVVAREAGGVLRQEGSVWSVLCRSEADALFAAMRLATEVDGIVVEEGAVTRIELSAREGVGSERSLLFPPEARVGSRSISMPGVENGIVMAATSVRDQGGATLIVRAVESSAGAPWLEVWARDRDPVVRGPRGGWTRISAEEFESWEGLRDRFLAVMRREIVLHSSSSRRGVEGKGRRAVDGGRGGFGR